jgi:peptidoglycan/LPS O-acetylase OafA/YrhL
MVMPASLREPAPQEFALAESARTDAICEPRIAGLDGLRGLAILGVITSKAVRSNGFPAELASPIWNELASIGVELFFVISGYLITTLLIREKQNSGTIDLWGFYGRRALRILPAWLTFLATLAVLQVVGALVFRPIDWLTAATWTINLLPEASWDMGHGWSLSIEEHFYLLWPLAFAKLSTKSALRAIAVLLGLAFVARWGVLLGAPQLSSWLETFTLTRLDSIAVGCAMAYLAQDHRFSLRLDGYCAANWFWPLWLVMLGLQWQLSTTSTKLSIGVGYPLVAVLLGSLVWCAVRVAPWWLTMLLQQRWLVGIGWLSYSLYVWHRLFLRPHEVAGSFTSFPANFLMLSIAALASYYLIERRCLQWKERLGLRALGRQVSGAGLVGAGSPHGSSGQ